MDVSYLHKTDPYQHQADCFYFCYKAALDKGYFAEFMEQGTGKSKVQIDIVSNLFAEQKLTGVLLIAPNGIHSQWADEQIPEHSPIPYTTFTFDSDRFAGKGVQREWERFKKPLSTIRWLCANVESFSYPTYLKYFREFLLSGRCMVAIDEATDIKNPEAQRTINIIQGLAQLTKARNTILSLTPLAAYRSLMTGFPVTQEPYDLWAMTEFLQHNYYGLTYGAFKARYGLEKLDKVPGSARYDAVGTIVPGSGKVFSRRISVKEMNEIRTAVANGGTLAGVSSYMALKPVDVEYIVKHPSLAVPYKNLAELKGLLKPFAFFALKKDCLDLPPKIFEKVPVKLSPEQKKIYEQLKAEMYAEYAGRELTALIKIALYTRLAQVVGGVFPYNDTAEGDDGAQPKYVRIGKTWPKLDAIMHGIEETHPPMIVTARFTAEIDILYEEVLKRTSLSAFKCHGAVPTAERRLGIQAFKEGSIDVLVASVGTIGRGQNLQVSGDMHIYSNSGSSEKRENLTDRIHRLGMTDHATYTDYITIGTMDTKIMDALRLRKDLLDYMRGDSIEEFLR